jgi:hypothetical protein
MTSVLRTLIKQSLMWLYSHEVISIETTQRLYDRFGLSEY